VRHRRRTNTQIIKRKNHSNPKIRSPKKNKKSKIPFVILGLIIIAILGFIYKNELLELFPIEQITSLVGNSEQVEVEVADPKPSIPSKETTQQDIQYYSPIEKKIQLEILNGCGEKGVAKKLTALLKKSKYDIVNSGNYMEKGKINWLVEETKIIDQINNQENVRDLADHMGILYSNVEVFENPSPIADITIVIGKDYKLLSIFQ
jgi:hypothetical protein